MERSSSYSKENQKLNKALRRGFWTVITPSMFIFIGSLFLFLFLGKWGYIDKTGTVGVAWLVFFFLGGFVIAWLIWSVQVPKWRLEAYKLVDDIAELKKHAVARGIIWPSGHFFEKTEIASIQLKEEIKKIEDSKRKKVIYED